MSSINSNVFLKNTFLSKQTKNIRDFQTRLKKAAHQRMQLISLQEKNVKAQMLEFSSNNEVLNNFKTKE